jgi:hypothetical protein
MPTDIHRAFESVTGLSPARVLAQKLRDQQMQREAGGVAEIPQYAGPMPTLYNVNSGQWEQTTPMQAQLLGVPIGAPTPNPGYISGGDRVYKPYDWLTELRV